MSTELCNKEAEKINFMNTFLMVFGPEQKNKIFTIIIDVGKVKQENSFCGKPGAVNKLKKKNRNELYL